MIFPDAEVSCDIISADRISIKPGDYVHVQVCVCVCVGGGGVGVWVGGWVGGTM